jgi:hypothetical protein
MLRSRLAPPLCPQSGGPPACLPASLRASDALFLWLTLLLPCVFHKPLQAGGTSPTSSSTTSTCSPPSATPRTTRWCP